MLQMSFVPRKLGIVINVLTIVAMFFSKIRNMLIEIAFYFRVNPEIE